MNFIPCDVPAVLTPDVEGLFYLGDYTPEHDRERLVPDGRISLVIELDEQPRWVVETGGAPVEVPCRGGWLSGLHDVSMVFTAPPNTRLMAVRFRPGGLYALVTDSVAAYTNQVVPANNVFGPSFADLRRDLVDASPEGALKRLADWLVDQRQREPEPAVVEAVDRLLATPSAASLHRVLEEQPFSHRHFVKRFTEHVGVAPKRLQRVLRFRQIFERIQRDEQVGWAGISQDCGYYDQAHFAKEFKAFSGINPTAFLAIDTDRDNFLPEP